MMFLFVGNIQCNCMATSLSKVRMYVLTYVILLYTVEPVYYGHLGTNQMCPDYQGVLISRSFYMIKCNQGFQLHKCMDYAGVLITH